MVTLHKFLATTPYILLAHLSHTQVSISEQNLSVVFHCDIVIDDVVNFSYFYLL